MTTHHHASLLPSLAHSSSRCRHAASSKESILDATFLTAVELIITAEHAHQGVTPAPLQSSSSLLWSRLRRPPLLPSSPCKQSSHTWLLHMLPRRQAMVHRATTEPTDTRSHAGDIRPGAQTPSCPDRHTVQTTLDLPGDTRPLAHCDRTTSGRSSSSGST
jgi:hypothetical protein